MVNDRLLDDIPPPTLYRLLRLRSAVFVVEQECIFLDLDGRDLEPGCRQLWIEEDGDVIAGARVLDEGDVRRIGRVVTSPAHRGRGWAGRLIEHALATSAGPWLLDAQSHLADWYGTFGFRVVGDEYLEDGIVHVPMRRDA